MTFKALHVLKKKKKKNSFQMHKQHSHKIYRFLNKSLIIQQPWQNTFYFSLIPFQVYIYEYIVYTVVIRP